MKPSTLIAFLLFIFTIASNSLLAEGPPINKDGHILGDYKAIPLTPDQKNQLKNSRVITLNRAQQSIAGLPVEADELFLLTANFNDCTCGLTYGIWFHPDSFAVSGSNYPLFDTLSENHIMPARSLLAIQQIKSNENSLRTLTISTEGDLFYMNKKIAQDEDGIYALMDKMNTALYPEVNELATNDSTPTDMNEQTITLNIPPLWGNINKDKVLMTFYKLHHMHFNEQVGKMIYQ